MVGGFYEIVKIVETPSIVMVSIENPGEANRTRANKLVAVHLVG